MQSNFLKKSTMSVVPTVTNIQSNLPTTLCQLLLEPLLLVVVNKTVSISSNSFQVQDYTLNAWHLDEARALKVKYVISLLGGIGVGCYPALGIGKRCSDGRTFFSNRDDIGNYIDLSYLVKGYDFKANKIKTNYKEIQYINC